MAHKIMALVIFTLMITATAEARPPDQDALAAVQAHWSYRVPPCGTVHWQMLPATNMGTHRGLSWAATCDIAVEDGQPFLTTCTWLAHEYGHLLGYDHDAGGVMGATPEMPASCLAADDVRVRRINAPRIVRKRRMLRRCRKLNLKRKARCVRRARAIHLAVTS